MKREETILEALDAAMADIAPGAAILFSGGVDSGILATVARRHWRPMLYTVGVEGSPDLIASEEAAECLNLPWTPMIIDASEVERQALALLDMVPPDDPVTLSFELPLKIVASQVREDTLITGQGADELFAGYSRYLIMGPEELESALVSDLEKVLEHAAPLERRIATHHGKQVFHPFLDPRVIQAARSIPSNELIVQGTRKAPLRHAAAEIGVGPPTWREKKAAQYGSGIMNTLRSLARRRSLTLREYLEELAAGKERYAN
jgi:asparagine synthase (glutamine-hydrolysing)